MSEEGKEEEKRGLEGTGLSLPPNRHGNLSSASGDTHLKQILHDIGFSKTPVTPLSLSLSPSKNASKLF